MTERKIKSSFVDLLLLIFINHNHLQLKNLWTPVLLRYYSLNFLLFFPISCISKAAVNKTWTQPWWNVISIHYLELKSYLTYYTKKCIFFIVWRYSVSILSLEEEQDILNIFLHSDSPWIWIWTPLPQCLLAIWPTGWRAEKYSLVISAEASRGFWILISRSLSITTIK